MVQMQVESIIGLIFVLAGVVVIRFAEKLSLFERRMVEKHPATRVTGWSGTRKGTISWRIVGLLLVVLGLVVATLPLLLLHHR
jgi:uncharacterized membrane protein YdcZ (DUF606 family)